MNAFFNEIVKYQKKAPLRKEDGVFIVEGIRMFREIPEELLKAVVFSQSFLKEHPEEETRVKNFTGVRVYQATDAEFARLSDTKTPQGVLAVCKQLSYQEEDLLSQGDGVFLLLENLQDPGNLGTVFRAAEAAGIAGILMDETTCDVFNPKVVRATMGAILRVKFAVTKDLVQTVKQMISQGGQVFAAHLEGSIPYDEADYRGLAGILIGNEGNGLSEAITEAANAKIRIPMEGHVESLNAAMAATILMYEAKRQRK